MGSNSIIFLGELQKSLEHLPKVEVEKVISFYAESIQDKIEDGIDEESVIASFGSIKEIVKNIEDEISIGAIVKAKVKVEREKVNVNKWLVIIIAILTAGIWVPILFAVITVALTVYILLWSIPITVAMVYGSFAIVSVSGIFCGIVRMFAVSFLTGLSYLGVGLLFGGIVIMLFRPLGFLGKKWLYINTLPFKKFKHYLINKMKKG